MIPRSRSRGRSRRPLLSPKDSAAATLQQQLVCYHRDGAGRVKILLAGAGGQLGQCLAAACERHELVALTIAHLTLPSLSQWSASA